MRLTRSDSGATAIEYAVIGALIGIGLIGSLVGTKTSLSAIFGTAATQMASAGSSSSAASSMPQPTVAMNFAQKTVKKRSVYTGCNLGVCGQGNTTEVTYTDVSNYNYRVASGSYAPSWHAYDTVSGFEFTLDGTGNFSPGDTFYVSNSKPATGPMYIDYMTVNMDGSMSGRREFLDSSYQTTSVQQGIVYQTSDVQWISTMVSWIKANP